MKVLYIAGAGRSGSTLLEMILGNIDGFFSVGEMRFFWQYVRKGTVKCGCGKLLRKCDFWSQVIIQFQQNHPVDISRVAQEAARIDRTRNMILFRIPLNPLNAADEFIRRTSDIYATVWNESGKCVIIDSSKAPSHLYILKQIADIDVRVIHLVRDGRAVAYSWSKRQKKELATTRKGDRMPARSPLTALLVWLAENFITRRLGSEFKYYQVLRYEDFVQNPQRELERSLSKLNLDRDLSLLEHSPFHVVPTHSVGGNPMRFLDSQIRITLREEWRNRMNPVTQKLLTAVGFEMLSHYRYI